MQGRRVLLIIAGGIAAYKSLDLIRRLRSEGAAVRCILTAGGAQFITPMAVAALSEDKVYGDLFSLTDEAEMGHIQLSREADLLLVAPATADLLAKMTAGLADDLASTALLATDKTVMVAPAMNVRMWDHAATQQNMATLAARGVIVIGPDSGAMACGEYGEGRMAEPAAIVTAVANQLGAGSVLAGRHALVTSGPTHEPIDPVRYIANRSSGRQGHALAAALAALGARTTLVSGPTMLADPVGVETIKVETAAQMLAACEAALPADVAVCAAAVADWRVAEQATQKMKKTGDGTMTLALTQNPDILRTLSMAKDKRPALVIGFAAETENIVANAQAKLKNKGCDWIVANDVSAARGTFGGSHNQVHLIRAGAVENWPDMPKEDVAKKLARHIADHLGEKA
ncbi:MAG: bifunctional phosphopantothenoylcysteine decarboxylase/phosphopantothenate--cysteine ligase CoaBC [Alphaproteobacteria bacterium]